MSWKARLDHLIADGEQAAYLESREALEILLAQAPEERWQIILSRDPRLERLVLTDYQWLLKMTVNPKASEVSEALSAESSYLGKQWKQYSEHLTKMMESSLAVWNDRLEEHTEDLTNTVETFHARWSKVLEQRLDFRAPLRLFLLVSILGLATIAILRSDSDKTPRPEIAKTATPIIQQNTKDLTKFVESSQSQWNELLEQRSQDLTKALESSQTRWLEQWEQRADFQVSGWLFLLVLIPGIIFSWILLRGKSNPWTNPENSTKDVLEVIESSQAQWHERFDRRSEALLNALEFSQNQMSGRLEQALREASERQERQREVLWKVMAMEELGLKLIAGNDFHAELMALRAVWSDSEVLARLKPEVIHGVPGRPLLLVTLEHLYGDLLIQTEEQQTARQSPLNSWWPFFYKGPTTINRIERIEDRVARALRELRKGDWNAAIEELADIKYPPIVHWTETARTRLNLEEWYSNLRQEIWEQHLGVESKTKSLASSVCFKTCRIPFCKTDKLCLKQLLIRFKKLAE